MEPLLRLKNISVHYNGVRALNGADLEIDKGEIVALMGPNGAGKSTVLKTIFGMVKTDSGEIWWRNSPVKPIPHEMVQLGMAFVPQGRRVFHHLTVEENLEIAGVVVKNKAELQRRMREVMEIFPALKAKHQTKSGSLSGGQQQMLSLARGLMVNPKLLLLDEPSLGLAPKIVKEIFAKISEINQRHKTAVLVVEHNLKSLLAIAHRAYVLDKGQVVFTGSSQEVEKSGILNRVLLGN